jgi:hypothetical protein
MIESRQPGTRRHRNPEFLPQPLAAELQLLDRRGDHVLDDHQARVRGDDQPLGRNQAMRHVARVLVQQRDGRDQLTNQAQCRVDVELQPALVRYAQDVGETRALDVVGDDRKSGRRDLDAVDAPHASVVRMPEVRQSRAAFAQRELERRHGGERRADAKDLQQLAGRAVGRDNAITNTVAEQSGLGTIVGHGDLAHRSAPAKCNGCTISPSRSSPAHKCRVGSN